MFKLFSLLVLIAVTGVQCNLFCDVHPFRHCGDFLDMLLGHSNGISLASSQTLDRQCGNITESIRCMREYLTACEDGMAAPAIFDIASDICQRDSRLGQAYRAHVTCVKELFDGKVPCTETLNEFRDFMTSSYYKDQATGIAENQECIVAPILKHCILSMVEKECGSGAKAVVNEIVSGVISVFECNPEDLVIFADLFSQFLSERNNRT